MRPEIFGIEHILYLVVAFALMITAWVLCKLYAKSYKSRSIIIRVAGLLLFSAVLWNRIMISINGKNWWNLIPNSFCGLTNMTLGLTLMIGKRDNIALHYLAYVGFIGGLVTIIYPDFISQNISFWYPQTISGLLHHTLSVFAFVLLFLLDWFRPNYRKWVALPFGFFAYITLGVFMMTNLGISSAFYINSPILSGTNLYCWQIALIFAAIYIVFMITVEIIRWEMRKRQCIRRINVQLDDNKNVVENDVVTLSQNETVTTKNSATENVKKLAKTSNTKTRKNKKK